jgi:hypothetical protein
MSGERIKVLVPGNGSRLYPVEKVKIVDDLPNGNTLIVVEYPSWSVTGEVTPEGKAQLLGHRLLTGAEVVAKRDPASPRVLYSARSYSWPKRKLLGTLQANVYRGPERI